MKWISLHEVRAVIASLILMILGIVLLNDTLKKKAFIDGDGLDINVISIEDITDNIMVEGDLYANFGSFAEEYKEKNGVKRSDSKYTYLIIVGESEFIGLQIKGDDVFEQMEQQAKDSFQYVNDETSAAPQRIYVRGPVERMDSEYYQFMKEYMVSMGFTNEQVNACAYPYYINTCYYEEWQRMLWCSILCIGIGAAVIIIAIVSVRVRKHKAGRA